VCDTFISVTSHQKTPIFSIIIETSTTEELFKMRKIESQMNRAIRGQRNWTSGNTTVFTTDNGLESTVYLHGNHIATFDHVHQNLYIFDGGWQSNTTKSRLNALCYEFNTGFKVIQRDWTWYLQNFLGTKQLFISGMEVA
jgi:hypothetical protein